MKKMRFAEAQIIGIFLSPRIPFRDAVDSKACLILLPRNISVSGLCGFEVMSRLKI
jgi:hypothetical protein